MIVNEKLYIIVLEGEIRDFWKEEDDLPDIIKMIVTNVLTALLSTVWIFIILAILFMFFYLFTTEHGWKAAWRKWIDAFKSKSEFRRVFLLAFYTALILFRTLLNRNLWLNPLVNVMGGWSLYDANGQLTTESIENVILFVPFSMLLLWIFGEKLCGSKIYFYKVIRKSCKIVFLCSLSIEVSQVIFRVGTFQIADLFYNTLGGIIGGIIYYIVYKLVHRSITHKT